MLVIAGPTASGKSGLALRLAEELDGTVINADSMQVYADLHVLTARPSADDEGRAPHVLYGYRDGAEACTAAAWAADAATAITEARASGRIPIVAGGTGMYLKTLMEGISSIPDVPGDVKSEGRRLRLEQGNEALYEDLKAKDPEGAAKLKPKDRQRILRAWEVVTATGTPLHRWQADHPPRPLVDGTFQTVLLKPPREDLYARCDARFTKMLDQGALAEVEALVARGLDPGLPVMKALGVPELAEFLAGTVSRDEAITKAQQHTRNYAKRQTTWFRTQFHASETLDAQFSESLFQKIFPKIRHLLLT